MSDHWEIQQQMSIKGKCTQVHFLSFMIALISRYPFINSGKITSLSYYFSDTGLDVRKNKMAITT